MIIPATSIPWRCDEVVSATGSRLVVGKASVWVAQVWHGSSGRQSDADSNAAFIVTACNAHDELVAALQGLINHRDELKLGDYPAVTRARAALAKVQP